MRRRGSGAGAGSWASTPGVARSMRSNRSRDTRPEMEIRRRLHARGLRYRVDRAPLPPIRRRADIVFTAIRLAVFVDGCFWHGCPEHGSLPKRNSEYWTAKLERNRSRDAETDGILRGAGWTVLRIWEHEAPEDAVERVCSAVERLRGQRGAE